MNVIDVERPSIVKPGQDVIRRMQQDALGRLHARLDAIGETYEANKQAIRKKAGGEAYWCTGWLTLSSLLITTGIKIEDLEFTDFPEVLKYKGNAYGLGVGFGKLFGSGIFSEKPSHLIGKKVNIELAFAVVVAGGVQTSFWDGGELIGTMDFVGGGVGGGAFWGDGEFSEQ